MNMQVVVNSNHYNNSVPLNIRLPWQSVTEEPQSYVQYINTKIQTNSIYKLACIFVLHM